MKYSDINWSDEKEHLKNYLDINELQMSIDADVELDEEDEDNNIRGGLVKSALTFSSINTYTEWNTKYYKCSTAKEFEKIIETLIDLANKMNMKPYFSVGIPEVHDILGEWEVQKELKKLGYMDDE